MLILDENEIGLKERGHLLKFTEGGSVAVTQKYKDMEFIKVTSKMIFASNLTDQVKKLMEDPAFLNRFIFVPFTEQCDISNKEYDKIKKELPRILIYCNRELHKSLKLRRIRDNNKLKLLIEKDNVNKTKFLV